MLTVSTAVVNLLLGAAYLLVGALVFRDARRQEGRFGTPLGYALVAMAFTCGPHHFEHGLHIALGEGRAPGLLDLGAVLVGLPAGLVFAWLVLEATRGRAGDRTIAGTPRWLATLGFGFVAYVTVMAAAVIERLPRFGEWNQVMLPNLLLVGIYMAVGVVILRAQTARRPLTGGWSLAGISLGAIFPTCALMHGAWVLYGALGTYEYDAHLLVIDWLSVPAALYFLWVVHRLRQQAVEDWDEAVAATA